MPTRKQPPLLPHDAAADPRHASSKLSVARALSAADAELRREARRYKALVLETCEVAWVTTAEGEVTEDLPTWRAFTGQSRDAILGRGWMSAIHPNDARRVGEAWARSLETRTAHTDEFRVRRHDGSYRLLSTRAIPLLSEDGGIDEWVGTCTDVTDAREKQLQDALLVRAQELFSSQLDYEQTLRDIASMTVPQLAAWCVVHIREEDGAIHRLVVAHADPAKMRLAEEFSRRYPTDYDAPTGIGQVIRSGKPEVVAVITEDMLVRGAKDAEHLRVIRELELSSYMAVPLVTRGRALGAITLCGSAGKHYTQDDVEFALTLAGRAALAVDNARLYREAQRAVSQANETNAVLERKVAERTAELELARSKDHANLQRLKAMLAHLPLAALMMDESGGIIELNQRYCETFRIGMTAQEAMRIAPLELNAIFMRNIADPAAHMREVQATIAASQTRLGHDIPLLDGRIIQRDFLPIRDEAGAFRGQLFLYRDVTRERRIDASKSEFMSLASHQLRTPLTAIRWSFGRLHKNLAGQVGEMERKLLADGMAATARMSDTVKTMLQISRIQAGQVTPTRETIPLQPFLTRVVRGFEEEIARKALAVDVACSADLSVTSDPKLLEEIVANLAGNAVKYTPENGAVSLSASRSGNTIVLDVRDSGYGIPQHQQQRVFKKFFRGDNIVSRDPDGTGLGLYLASLVAGLLDGALDFTSVEGRGTTFTLRLPA